MALQKLAVLALSLCTAVAGVQVGDSVPSIDLDFGFPPEKISLAQRVFGKKVRTPRGCKLNRVARSVSACTDDC